jgi:hypothetical protein
MDLSQLWKSTQETSILNKVGHGREQKSNLKEHVQKSHFEY